GKPMKLLYVLPPLACDDGGELATYLRNARRALAELGHETFLLTWKVAATARKEVSCLGEHGVCINSRKKSLLREFGARQSNVAISMHLLPFILKYIEEWSPDLIETSDASAPLYAYLAMRRSRLLKKQHIRPVIAFRHGLQRERYDIGG